MPNCQTLLLMLKCWRCGNNPSIIYLSPRSVNAVKYMQKNITAPVSCQMYAKTYSCGEVTIFPAWVIWYTKPLNLCKILHIKKPRHKHDRAKLKLLQMKTIYHLLYLKIPIACHAENKHPSLMLSILFPLRSSLLFYKWIMCKASLI